MRGNPTDGESVQARNPTENASAALQRASSSEAVSPRREASMARRLLLVPILALVLLALGSGAALACGGLIAPGHAEVLRKATTLSAWHAGFEHYVTGFRFAGTASSFGYIVPLPGVPTKIEKGGGWTLERLEQEINPPVSELQ